jgi:uncharacterized protein (TIGR02453 family)
VTDPSHDLCLPVDALDFLAELEAHNHRPWFQSQRDRFEASILEPSRAFVTALGETLRPVAPELVADPRTDKSIFRMHRDTRFAKDKAPFKTHIGLILWEGDRPKAECSGFYLHIEHSGYQIGAGHYLFAKDQIAPWRDLLTNDAEATAELLHACKEVEAAGFAIEGATAKRVPRGCPADLPQSHLFRHSGLYAWSKPRPITDLLEPGTIALLTKQFTAMAPVHRWLVDHMR